MSFFTCETPDGADWTTCPLCNGYRTTIMAHYKLSNNILEDDIEYIKDDLRACDIDNDDLFDEINKIVDIEDIIYCIKCKIIFKCGSVYIERGCTSSTYFASVVKSFIFNDQIYEGMPIFKHHLHWKKLLKTNKISLKWSQIMEKNMATLIKLEKNN